MKIFFEFFAILAYLGCFAFLHHVSDQKLSSQSLIFWNTVIAISVFCLAKIGDSLLLDNISKVNPIYLPAGFNMAILFNRNKRFAWGIFFGTLLECYTNLFSVPNTPIWMIVIMICIISVSNTFQPILGNYIYAKQFLNRIFYTDSKFVSQFIFITFLVCSINACIGVGILFLGGIVPGQFLPNSIFDWWISDVAGILLLTPLLIALEKESRFKWNTKRFIEFLIFFVLMILGSAIFIGGLLLNHLDRIYMYMMIPFVLWSVSRFNPRISFFQVFLIGLIAVLGVFQGNSPFFLGSNYASFVQIQIFIIVIASMNLIIMASNIQRKEMMEQLEKYSSQLQKKVEIADSEIKVLSGLLPICAQCKNIRDKSGIWHPLEAYLDKHSEAKLTHGYCPDCANKILKE